MYFTIYKTTNLVNGRYYIGMHQTKNINDNYIGSGLQLRRAITKYGIENFKKEILHVYDTQQEMIEKEKQLVTESLCSDKNCYNLCVGGKGGPLRKGVKLSKKLKLKISKTTKEAMNRPEIKQRMSILRTGKKQSEAQKLKMSELHSKSIWISNQKLQISKFINIEHLAKYDSDWFRGRKFNNPFINSGTNFRK